MVVPIGSRVGTTTHEFACDSALLPVETRRWSDQDAMAVGGRGIGYLVGCRRLTDRSDPMPKQFDSHHAATAFDHDSTLVVALELSGKSWEAGAVVPGVARRPRRRLQACDMAELLRSIA